MLVERAKRLAKTGWTASERRHDALAAEWLHPSELELFERLASSDRAHSLALAGDLIRRGLASRHLMACALLHDVGKSLAVVRPLHDAAFMLLKRVHPSLVEWIGAPQPRSWRFPLWVLHHHAELGAQLAEHAGVESPVVQLIRRHHSDVSDAKIRLFQQVHGGR